MNISNVHLFLEEMGFDERVHEIHRNLMNHACYDCEDEHIITEEGFPFCPSCGVINFNKPEVVHDNEVVDPEVKRRTVSLYKRRLYIREKLNLMAGPGTNNHVLRSIVIL